MSLQPRESSSSPSVEEWVVFQFLDSFGDCVEGESTVLQHCVACLQRSQESCMPQSSPLFTDWGVQKRLGTTVHYDHWPSHSYRVLAAYSK